MSELKMEYNRGKSKMTIKLHKLFQVDGNKRLFIGHTKDVINHILKVGSDENIQQVTEWLTLNESIWFKEFNEMRIKAKRG